MVGLDPIPLVARWVSDYLVSHLSGFFQSGIVISPERKAQGGSQIAQCVLLNEHRLQDSIYCEIELAFVVAAGFNLVICVYCKLSVVNGVHTTGNLHPATNALHEHVLHTWLSDHASY